MRGKRKERENEKEEEEGKKNRCIFESVSF
jgi:hypothetical protein